MRVAGGQRAALVLGGATALLAGPSPACRHADAPPASCLEIRSPGAAVGFGAPFSISVTSSCPDPIAGEVTWRQTAGPPLRDLAVSDRGLRLTARTAPPGDSLDGEVPWGVVPVSPRTSGGVTLEAILRDGAGRELRREVHLAAADRSRGLPNTPVGARVHLGGEGWRLAARPAGSAAELDLAGALASLVPDVAGDWRLVDGRGRALDLRTARYDETLLDCGRAGCHAAIAEAAAGTAMTTVLARGLARAGDGPAFGPGYPGCAEACHATGDPGLGDGGFTHVARELGLETDPAHHLPSLAARRWEELPRPLRRLGGVGCLACHGPGALPAAAGRWSILGAGVCATCHDAPPRYGHVAAWRRSRMARADHDPRARGERACARCHTTWGFLAAASPAAPAEHAAPPEHRRPPADVGPLGIACAACHAPHDPAGTPAAGALLRAPAVPDLLAGTATASPIGGDRSRICLPCHAPEPGDPVPYASAAALWSGRGGLDPVTGRALAGTAPHGAVAGGCVGCHRAGTGTGVGTGTGTGVGTGTGTGVGEGRGSGHDFRVAPAACAPCHPTPPAPSDLRQRAARLWSVLGAAAAPPARAGTATPAHAGGARADRRTVAGRAAWNVLLVLEDPAAAAHNAPYARLLLDSAERAMATTAGRSR